MSFLNPLLWWRRWRNRNHPLVRPLKDADEPSPVYWPQTKFLAERALNSGYIRNTHPLVHSVYGDCLEVELKSPTFTDAWRKIFDDLEADCAAQGPEVRRRTAYYLVSVASELLKREPAVHVDAEITRGPPYIAVVSITRQQYPEGHAMANVPSDPRIFNPEGL